MSQRKFIFKLLQEHFHPHGVEALTVTARQCPFRVRADLQRAIDGFFTGKAKVLHFGGILHRSAHEALDLSSLMVPSMHEPPSSVSPEYEEMDIGEEESVRCLKNGLWLIEEEGSRFAMLFGASSHFGRRSGLQIQVMNLNDPAGDRISREFFRKLEEAVQASGSYRGKVLSLEMRESYSGMSTGLLVHRLKAVQREEVILPGKTLDLLDRNVIDFVRHRPALGRFGLPSKKGILFYGPPGTGKTHTIHYLAGALPGHTTFLITAEQVGLLDEYMTLARLLQPSVVVIEDADLIAQDRSIMGSACTQVLLHKLLNEMDGLRPDAEVLFILTTNRPETLETALASRPGRIDQAIEFPLPDEEGRAKLIRLYSRGLNLDDEVIRMTVKRTEKVSASFIKELMRRAAQFHLEKDPAPRIDGRDIESALEELLFAGGSLNRKLLGADGSGAASPAAGMVGNG
jgi:hypothetical protein